MKTPLVAPYGRPKSGHQSPHTKAAIALGLVVCLAVSVSWGAEEKTEPKPTNPRELFRILGVGDGYFDRLADGSPIHADENNVLLRVLFRLRLFPPFDVGRWALDSERLADAIGQPKEFRGSVFRLRGQVLEVEPIKPAADAAQRYDMAKYFRCRLQLGPSGPIAEVYTENVPAAWRNGAKPDAPGGALGVFLKVAERGSDRTTLVFAAPRLAWYPDTPLGRLGMNVGLLDDLKDQKPVAAEESEAFYQMLAAVGRAKPGELLGEAEAQLPKIPEKWRWTNMNGLELYSVVPLFNQPATQRGRLVDLLGTARRIEEIHVGDPDIVARFHIDHYYQVFLFTDDSYDKETGNGNPLTFCIRELPAGMPYGDLPRYGETVRIAGFFLKTWSYRVPVLMDPSLTPDPETHHQLSPLLVGRSLVWYPAPKQTNATAMNVIVIVLVVSVMLVIWVVAWRSRRHEEQWVEHEIEGPPILDSGIDLGQTEVRPDGSPDFSHLAEMDHGAEGPEGIHPKFDVPSPEPQAPSPKPQARSPKPEDPSPKTQARRPKPEDPSPKTQARRPKPEDPSPKTQARRPKPEDPSPKT